MGEVRRLGLVEIDLDGRSYVAQWVSKQEGDQDKPYQGGDLMELLKLYRKHVDPEGLRDTWVEGKGWKSGAPSPETPTLEWLQEHTPWLRTQSPATAASVLKGVIADEAMRLGLTKLKIRDGACSTYLRGAQPVDLTALNELLRVYHQELCLPAIPSVWTLVGGWQDEESEADVRNWVHLQMDWLRSQDPVTTATAIKEAIVEEAGIQGIKAFRLCNGVQTSYRRGGEPANTTLLDELLRVYREFPGLPKLPNYWSETGGWRDEEPDA